jgi:hypothetical protein
MGADQRFRGTGVVTVRCSECRRVVPLREVGPGAPGNRQKMASCPEHGFVIPLSEPKGPYGRWLARAGASRLAVLKELREQADAWADPDDAASEEDAATLRI